MRILKGPVNSKVEINANFALIIFILNTILNQKYILLEKLVSGNVRLNTSFWSHALSQGGKDVNTWKTDNRCVMLANWTWKTSGCGFSNMLHQYICRNRHNPFHEYWVHQKISDFSDMHELSSCRDFDPVMLPLSHWGIVLLSQYYNYNLLSTRFMH